MLALWCHTIPSQVSPCHIASTCCSRAAGCKLGSNCIKCLLYALQGLHDIPYKDLDLNSNSTVVGHTRHCVIYQTMYCGMPVTVKRLLPPRDPKTRTLFSLSSISRISPSSSHDAVLPLDSTPGLLHSSSDGPVAPMMLARASSQGLLPAGDCHSFAAQVQTDGPLQRWDRLCATVKAAKTALQQFAFHALSGQYFRQMQQRYEVSLLQLVSCFWLCMSDMHCFHQ